MVKSITKKDINFENLKYIKKSLESDPAIMKNKVYQRTILITRAGTARIAANISLDLIGAVASDFLIHITIKEEVAPYYIVFFLNSEYGQMQLERISSGSILKSIRSSNLKKIQIILSSKYIQNKIDYKLKKIFDDSYHIRKNIKIINKEILELSKY